MRVWQVRSYVLSRIETVAAEDAKQGFCKDLLHICMRGDNDYERKEEMCGLYGGCHGHEPGVWRRGDGAGECGERRSAVK